jgi:ribosome-binding factor A
MKLNRVNGEVQKVLAEAIRGELKDPRISPLTSVVDVYVAPDLKTCKVWVSVLGGEKEREDTRKGLKSAEGFLRSKLAKVINLRNTPELIFIMDESIAYGVQMSRKIQEVMSKEDDIEESTDGSSLVNDGINESDSGSDISVHDSV